MKISTELECIKNYQTKFIDLKNPKIITKKKFNIGVRQQTRAQKKRLSELRDSSFEIMHADKQKE